MSEELNQQILVILEPFLLEYDVDLVELSMKCQNHTYHINILADKPSGGITIDECGAINKKVAEQIEEQELLQDAFVVSVGSPGLDRPLKTIKDFKRVIGRQVQFFLSEKTNEKLEHTGFVKDTDDQGVTVEGDSQEFTIPYDKINKALQVIE